jgi:pimeloyl-ACP methyl ester carboxylesterase
LNAYVQSLQGTIDPSFARTWIASNTVNPLSQDFLEARVADSLKVPLATWQQLLASRLAATPIAAVGPITARTLVLYGDQDVYVEEGQQLLAAEIPQATVIIYPETGHALHWDCPRRFVDDLQAFLTGELKGDPT